MESVLDTRKILKLLPHRYPFLLIDKVLSKEVGPDKNSRVGHKVVAVKNVSMNEPYFQGHFPDLPVMPGVLQIEAMAQAACLGYFRPGDGEMDFFIASIQDARFRRMVVPGDTLTIEAEIIKDRGSMVQIQVSAKVEGQVAAEAQILAKVSPKADRNKL